jgi:hypothetical protein
VAKFGDVCRPFRSPQLGKQVLLVNRLRRCGGRDLRSGEKPLMIERRKKRTALLKRAEAVESHGIKTLEDVAIFPVLRSAPAIFDKPLYLLKLTMPRSGLLTTPRPTYHDHRN